MCLVCANECQVNVVVGRVITEQGSSKGADEPSYRTLATYIHALESAAAAASVARLLLFSTASGLDFILFFSFTGLGLSNETRYAGMLTVFREERRCKPIRRHIPPFPLAMTRHESFPHPACRSRH